jgi:hypothetical protein
VSINESAYEALCEVERTTGYPTHFKDDLYFHDRLVMTEWHPPEPFPFWRLAEGSPFLWITRENGTHLIGVDSESGEVFNRDIINSLIYRIMISDAKESRCYLWSNGKLTKIKLEESLSMLDQELRKFRARHATIAIGQK